MKTLISALVDGFLTPIYRLITHKTRSWEPVEHILAAKALMCSSGWRSNLTENESCEFIRKAEFKVFSQFGDDGIIQALVQRYDLGSGVFVELGVSDYFESNTRFLLMNNLWKGFVVDGDLRNMDEFRSSPVYWKLPIRAEARFVSKENVAEIFDFTDFDSIDLLHIDLDGIDYWIWDSIDFRRLKPKILIAEYNGHLGFHESLSVPYRADFDRFKAHSSGLCFGASLKAFDELFKTKGYSLVGCNSAGNNAYFVLDELFDFNPRKPLSALFVPPAFREARNASGELNRLSDAEIELLVRSFILERV